MGQDTAGTQAAHVWHAVACGSAWNPIRRRAEGLYTKTNRACAAAVDESPPVCTSACLSRPLPHCSCLNLPVKLCHSLNLANTASAHPCRPARACPCLCPPVPTCSCLFLPNAVCSCNTLSNSPSRPHSIHSSALRHLQQTTTGGHTWCTMFTVHSEHGVSHPPTRPSYGTLLRSPTCSFDT